MSPKANTIFQIKVFLKYSKPPIWRRVLVRSDTRLDQMHEIIQAVMDWDDSHLHQFIIDDEYYGYHPFANAPDLLDSRKFELSDFMGKEGDKFIYEYDFGDSWEHILLLEKILPAEAGVHYPTCTAGERACPPEDIGGMWGYDEFLEALADPDHEMYEEYIDWVEDEFDPEAFDLEGTRKYLESIIL